MVEYTDRAPTKAPPQADFVYYALRPVSRLNAKIEMERSLESCVCVLVGGNYAIIPKSQLEAFLDVCRRSR